jgi:hypothetical protein
MAPCSYDQDGTSSDLSKHDHVGDLETTVGSLVGEHHSALTGVSTPISVQDVM